MFKGLSVQLDTIVRALTLNYINSLLSICASGPLSNSRLHVKHNIKQIQLGRHLDAAQLYDCKTEALGGGTLLKLLSEN